MGSPRLQSLGGVQRAVSAERVLTLYTGKPQGEPTFTFLSIRSSQ